MISKYRRLLVWAVFALFSSFILAACSGSGYGSSGQTVDVNVTATDFKYESSLTTFKQGVTYHFIVTNKGAVAHDFWIMAPSDSQMTPDQASKVALVGFTSDTFAAGATKTVDYTFTKAYPAGSLEIACHATGHYDSGMHLPITVQ